MRINEFTNKLTATEVLTYWDTLRLAVDDINFTTASTGDMPYVLASDLFGNVTTLLSEYEARIADNEANIQTAQADIVVNADTIAARGELVYAAFINWQNSSITKTEHVNKDGFISSISELAADKLGLYLLTSNTSWQTELEILTTANPLTNSSRNRNVHIFYEASSYLSLYLIDSSGEPHDDAGFWIRIYNWG